MAGDIPNIDDDDYVANLLKQDAKNAAKRYDMVGLSAFLPKNRSTSKPLKPNTRFLRHIIRETDTHNAALLAKEAEESRARLKAMDREERRDKESFGRLTPPYATEVGHGSRSNKKRRRDESSDRETDRDMRHSRRKHSSSRHHKEPREHERDRRIRREKRRRDESDDDGRERRSQHSTRRRDKDTRRSHRDESYSDDYSTRRREGSSKKHRRRRSSSRSSSRSRTRSPGHTRRHASGNRAGSSHSRSHRARHPEAVDGDIETAGATGDLHLQRPESGSASRPRISSPASDSDPLEALVGPLPPTRHSTVRSKGRGAHKANTTAMDARFSSAYDPQADVQLNSDVEDDWGDALEALRDRQHWKQQGAKRLRDAGFTDDQVKRWETGREKTEDDVKWTSKGESREWDRGKVVDDDGDVALAAEWGRLK